VKCIQEYHPCGEVTQAHLAAVNHSRQPLLTSPSRSQVELRLEQEQRGDAAGVVRHFRASSAVSARPSNPYSR